MRKKIIKITVFFLIVMALFTILSRVAYNLTVASVTVEQPTRKEMGPVIEAQGVIKGKKEIAVSTKENQLVETVEVSVGQYVKKDQLLYSVNLEEIDKQIQEKKTEIQIAENQIASTLEATQAAEEARKLQIEQAQSDYNRAEAAGNIAIQQAEEELFKAEERYQQYLSDPEKFPDLTKDALEQDVKAKEDAYQEAVKAKDDSLYNAQKAIDSASIQVAADDGGTYQFEVEKDAATAEIEELNKLKENQGQIFSPVNGIVNEIGVRAGMRTSGTGDIWLEDISEGLTVTAVFPIDNERYLKRDQKVEIVTGQEISQEAASNIQNLTIKSIIVDEETAEISVSIDVPANTLSIGSSVQVKVPVQSEIYDTCVPVAALNVGERGKYYVNVIEQEQGILGDEWIARRRDVEILFKNYEYAAISGVGNDTEVIVRSSRIVEDGMPVKRDEIYDKEKEGQ